MPTVLLFACVLGFLYVALNVRRLCWGRRWAFSFCQLAKEWDERERARLLAVRAARAQSAKPPPTV